MLEHMQVLYTFVYQLVFIPIKLFVHLGCQPPPLDGVTTRGGPPSPPH